MDPRKVLAVQTRVGTNICNFLKNTKSKKSAAAQTISYLEARLHLLRKYFDDFYARHEQLIESESSLKNEDYFTDSWFDAVEVAYIDATAEISDDIERLRTPRNDDQSGSQTSPRVQTLREDDSVKVPRVTLPSFSGNRDEWESFKQRFTSLIINKRNYSEVDKLQFLLSCLQGKAATRLSDIEITGENFRVAWEQLDKQYGGQRRRLYELLEKLIQLKPIRARNAQDISELLDVVVVTVRALQKLTCDVAAYNHWLVHCILRKLDSHTKETFKISKESDSGFYQYKELIAFLENRLDFLDSEKEKPDSRSTGGSSSKSSGRIKSASNSFTAAHTADVVRSDPASSPRRQAKCFLCQADHSLSSCEKFNAINAHQRFDCCKKAKLRLNCLGKSHLVSACKSSHRCFVCRARHHTKLHFDAKTQVSSDEANTSENSSPIDKLPENSVSVNFATVNQFVLLATAKIIVSDSFQNSITARALIDPGAERSFITERLTKQLTIKRKLTSVAILGVGGQSTAKATREASVVIRSLTSRQFNCPCSALILPELTRLLPSREITAKNWPHIQGLQLADPEFAIPGKIDIILGADMYGSILQEGVIKGPAHAPVAQSTVFGWILTGAVESQCSDLSVAALHTVTDASISQLLTKFWEIEEIPISRSLTPEEEYCENHFASTFSRNSEGRFVVRLPFATKKPFVDSRDIAVACLFRSEKRRRSNPKLQEAYANFMQEYESLGHMQAVPQLSENDNSYFFPHHAVFRADSNKIRVVFNASQRCAAGYSLNDLLYPGPKLQSDITIVITLWRFCKFAMMTDIVKMFRQILVHKDDINWQRLVWRADSKSPIQDYQALTVTYGTTSAPYLSIRSLIQLAKDGRSSHPRAALLLSKQIYVDDIFLGDDNEAEVLAQRDELIDLLASAGMTLGKWASNTPELLLDQPGADITEIPTSSGEIVSTLGLKWDTSSDVFLFKASLPPIDSLVSKRTVLSDTARLFDPLGFIAPVLIKAKILLQDMWINQLDWDAPLPEDLLAAWLTLRSEYNELSTIRIPRWINTSQNSEWHLHGFSDASKRAYAAAVYAVIPGKSGCLIMAKTRVAPVKVETIPRLELCGATLLARLSKHVIDGLCRQPNSTNFWTDSKVVLDWLQGHPSRWPTFVANRVSEIVTTFLNAAWRHVPTKDNPADCASRGSSPLELARSDIWWKGPHWLPCPSEEWPDQLSQQKENSQSLTAVVAKVDTNDRDDFMQSLERISGFSRIIRVLAYCRRWKTRNPEQNSRKFSGLSALELARAKISLIYSIQQTYFKTDIDAISKGKAVLSSSALARLSPFIDSEGLVRVGGRLQYASLPYSERHPIVLPGRCRITRLLIEETHRITHHGGVQLMKSVLQRNYWIVRGNRLIAAVYHRCITCVRFGARPASQQMAPLPAERLRQARPFSITGLDFAGPFPLLFSKGRRAKSTKGYVAIFICLSIKAVHLEVVSDLSTEAFLAAFSRFSSRRGLCSVLYSDNGTNFKGANAELQRLFHQTSDFAQHVFPQLAARGTEWKFIPPRAPHFGGLWESAVRSFKYHLRRVVGHATFTFQEFTTLTTKIEACLNSRPLCPLSSEAHDPVALTPGHFLVGTSLLTPPEPIQDSSAPPRASIIAGSTSNKLETPSGRAGEKKCSLSCSSELSGSGNSQT